LAGFETGAVVGQRFEIVGVLGRGGTATVYLADDRLRQQRVALKVVHEHLSGEPSTRRRLHREVQSASLLHHDAALVPHDVHELDGRLALSMPYHPGATLEERVDEEGPLPVEEVRRIGRRLAEALTAAHRAGVLHRDVTASNVLSTRGGHDTALTDFGLARLRDTGTRSTTVLGTAGYAAPEIYAGQRSDPRSDLYGLGAVLYLAATGRPAFDARDPMTALRRQLEGVTPIRELRPGFPADLAALIESLLAPEPEDRPAGARQVLDQLDGAGPAAPMAPGRREDAIVRQYLPPGDWTVVVRERREDKPRRERLRYQRGVAPSGPEVTIAKGLQWLKDLVGLPDDPTLTPEDALANVVAEEAALRPGSLEVPPVVLDRRFRLVDTTDPATAHRLAEGARSAGFRARPVAVGEPRTPIDWLAAYFWVPIAVGWPTWPFVTAALAALTGIDMAVIGSIVLPSMIALSIALPIWATAHRGPRDPNAEHLPVAWRASLAGTLKEGVHPPPQYAVGVRGEAPRMEAEPSRTDRLRSRVEAALASLTATIEDPHTELSKPEQHDLRSTARELRQTALQLADEVERIEAALVRTGAPDDEVATLERRLARLQTRRMAGEDVDDAAFTALEKAIAEHESDLAMEAELEARLAASTAQLLEIASTASKVQRQIVLGAEGPRARQSVERLQREVEASAMARREAAMRQRASQTG